jgi:hypothetical protein
MQDCVPSPAAPAHPHVSDTPSVAAEPAPGRLPHCLCRDPGGERTISFDEYRRLCSEAGGLDLLIDATDVDARGSWRVLRRGPGGEWIEGSLRRREAALIMEVIRLAPRTVLVRDLAAVQTGSRCPPTHDSVRKTIEKARFHLDRGKNRTIHTVPDADPARVGFRFRPPERFGYAVLFPLAS